MIAVIIACEIAFWVVLAAGLAVRYALRNPRWGGRLLLAVPLVDVVLLVVTVIDLRGGTPPSTSHGLAAVYLGFSVAFGHSLVTWADARVAHRFAGGPPPAPKPASGTPERLRHEWVDFGRAVLAVAVTAAVLGLMSLLVGSRADTTSLFGSLAGLGIMLVVWFLGWTLPETAKARKQPVSR